MYIYMFIGSLLALCNWVFFGRSNMADSYFESHEDSKSRFEYTCGFLIGESLIVLFWPAWTIAVIMAVIMAKIL